MVTAVVALLVGTAGVAAAATSHQFVYHENGARAGEVWFNSGAHNLDKGRNSFTIKDSYCGDGWRVGVHYQVPELNIWKTTKLSADCAAEISFSIWPNSVYPHRSINWRGYKISTTTGETEYEPWVWDWVD